MSLRSIDLILDDLEPHGDSVRDGCSFTSFQFDAGCVRVDFNAYMSFHTAERHLIAVLKPSILLQREIWPWRNGLDVSKPKYRKHLKFLAQVLTTSPERHPQTPTLQISMLIFPVLISSPQILFVNSEISATSSKKHESSCRKPRKSEFFPSFWCIRSSWQAKPSDDLYRWSPGWCLR